VILGIDEAGRGPWAGPLVVGAVVLGGAEIEGLTDSKKLSKKRREALEPEIIAKALGYGLGWVSAAELDEIGMSAALRLATVRAVSEVQCRYDEIIIDGTVNFLSETGKGKYVKTMPKADLLIPSVSAASILAKVARDRYMTELAQAYPEYGFASHAGYGVAKHRAAIEEYGVTPEHRLSFAPLEAYRETPPKATRQPHVRRIFSNLTSWQPAELAPLKQSSAGQDARLQKIGNAQTATQPSGGISCAPVTTKQVGDKAESAVAEYLEARGHRIVARNWKTRFCEIDIISELDEAVYFTEVKYRKTADWGDGMSAITTKKLRQMRYAAEVFGSHFKQLAECNQRLAAASVSGEDFTVDEWMCVE
jgi:ribonuclease HII